MNYLIDTNVFFDILLYIAGKPSQNSDIDCQKIMQGNCFISELTEIEIVSVIGKYARGRSGAMCLCNREYLDENDELRRCSRRYRTPNIKKWSNKRTRDMLKLAKDIVSGYSGVWKVTVLPVSRDQVDNAKVFILKALKNNFGSLDAMIAGTKMEYNHMGIEIITKDGGFRAALGQHSPKTN